MANIIPTLAIVMPCYNEGKVLKKTLTRVSQELEKLSFGRKISAKSFIMCVDDGSLGAHHIVRINIRRVDTLT